MELAVGDEGRCVGVDFLGGCQRSGTISRRGDGNIAWKDAASGMGLLGQKGGLSGERWRSGTWKKVMVAQGLVSCFIYVLTTIVAMIGEGNLYCPCTRAGNRGWMNRRDQTLWALRKDRLLMKRKSGAEKEERRKKKGETTVREFNRKMG